MANEIENADATNSDENIDSINNETGEIADPTALKEKVKDLSEKNRQLFERAKKAEGFEKKDGQWVKTQKPEVKPEIKPEVKLDSQSNEPDYARLAFLSQKGVEHPDDVKLVKDEANRLKLPLTDILSMEHIKGRLEANKDERVAKTGMPKGHGRSSGTSQAAVEYWLAKGETPTDNQQLAEEGT